jgi:hypothetical protein
MRGIRPLLKRGQYLLFEYDGLMSAMNRVTST